MGSFPNAPLQITRIGWYVPFLFPKILAHSWKGCYYCCIICFTVWSFFAKNELHPYFTYPKKKKNEPRSVSDYRPISLGNVVSRVVSKVLANKLKLNLPNVISDSQSAFVPNQLITDNTTVAFEVFHKMRNKRIRKKGQMAIKLDISKAYDQVEWAFLQHIVLKLGIDGRWVQLAMETIHTASYSILINGEPKGYITPSRGIKQGDPLSPYLFLLCAKSLSSFIRKATEP